MNTKREILALSKIGIEVLARACQFVLRPLGLNEQSSCEPTGTLSKPSRHGIAERDITGW